MAMEVINVLGRRPSEFQLNSLYYRAWGRSTTAAAMPWEPHDTCSSHIGSTTWWPQTWELKTLFVML